jgi:uncharacterized membrane protein HdeD (DUF308 family)
MSVESTSVPVIVKKSVNWSIALSVLIIIAGALGIILPPLAGFAATVFFGWLLIFCGIAHLVFAWHARGTGAIIWQVLIGIAYVVIGSYLLLNPLVGMLSLTFGLTIYLFAEAFLEFIMGFQLRRTTASRWLFFDAIITLILAIMIWRAWPFNSDWVLGTLVGISLLFSGTARLMMSLSARRLTTA